MKQKMTEEQRKRIEGLLQMSKSLEVEREAPDDVAAGVINRLRVLRALRPTTARGALALIGGMAAAGAMMMALASAGTQAPSGESMRDMATYSPRIVVGMPAALDAEPSHIRRVMPAVQVSGPRDSDARQSKSSERETGHEQTVHDSMWHTTTVERPVSGVIMPAWMKHRDDATNTDVWSPVSVTVPTNEGGSQP